MSNSYDPNNFYSQTTPGQFGPPPPPQNENDTNPYGNKILLGLVIATVISLILTGLGGNNNSSDHSSFIGNAGFSIFMGVTISILLIDWNGFASLRGWIKWQQMDKDQKTGLGCLFLFVFPFTVCIYLVRACLASFQTKPSLPFHSTQPASQNRRTSIGIIIGSVVTLICLAFGTGTYATAADTPSSTTIAQTSNISATSVYATPTTQPTPKPILTPTPTPIPIPTATPTPIPVPQQSNPQPPQAVGVNGNPWGYDFNPGNVIYSPPGAFCSYFSCIGNFWNGRGYVEECKDGMYSKSGGISGSCSYHGGNLRPLYSH